MWVQYALGEGGAWVGGGGRLKGEGSLHTCTQNPTCCHGNLQVKPTTATIITAAVNSLIISQKVNFFF